MFRRRRRAEEDKDETQGLPESTEPATAEERPTGRPVERPEVSGSGPWDAEEAHPELQRVDLGGLRLPVSPDFEIQLQVAGEHIVGATVLAEESALHMQAFAAPRRSGIWDEVRAELVREVGVAGGKVEERDGPFGPELAGTVPAEGKGQQQQVRYLGVDGPRWFLRAIITGRATLDETAAATLEGILRDVVVVRGDQPMAPKEPLELRLPAEARQQVAEPEVENFSPFERGPEISEIR